MRKASERKVAQEAAFKKGVALIRKNGFDPGDKLAKEAIRKFGHERALVVLQVVARTHRKFVPVH